MQQVLNKQNIKAISFDLDDTLWDNKPVLIKAERALWQWLEKNAPKIPQQFSIKKMIQQRQFLAENHPEIAHDISALRKKGLLQVCEIVGESPEVAQQAFEFFVEQRNRITIAPEVYGLLNELKKQYRLCAISNGNSDIFRLGLDQYFEFLVNPQQAGVLKPDQKIFKMAAEKLQLEPQQIVHVGDSLETDVKGANQAGFLSVWFNDKHADFNTISLQQQLEAVHKPTIVVNSLQQLADILRIEKN